LVNRSVARRPGLIVARSVLRALVSVALLVTAYYLLPLDRASTGAVAAILGVGLVCLIVLVVFQIRSIIVSPYPGLRAVEALAVSVSLVLLLFAAAYEAMSQLSAGSFGGHLTHSDALYFTVTVFATVGFGDITAKTEAARLTVTGQMVVDIVIIGFVVKAISYAVKTRRENQPPAADRGPDPSS
jgi:hypothetical protein